MTIDRRHSRPRKPGAPPRGRLRCAPLRPSREKSRVPATPPGSPPKHNSHRSLRIPSGRIVGHFGTRRSSIVGLIAMAVGTSCLASLPTTLGVPGYIASLIVLTAGYSLFLAANNTAAITNSGPLEPGVISGILNFSRFLGLSRERPLWETSSLSLRRALTLRRPSIPVTYSVSTYTLQQPSPSPTLPNPETR